MAQQNAARMASAWDQAVHGYDEWVSTLAEGIARESINIMGVGPGQKVLDVAAGPGVFSIQAARAGADVLAVDFSQGMVDHVRATVKRIGVDGVRAEVMNGQDLQLEDDSFDVAFSSLGIMLFPDRAAGMREFCRVLKPGGMGAIAAFTGPEGLEISRLIMGAMKVANPDYKPSGPSPLFSLADPDVFRDEMLTAGFTHVNLFTIRSVIPISSPEAFLPQMAEALPVWSQMLNGLTDGQRQVFGEAFVDQLRNEQGDGPFGTEAEVRIGIGVK
jgi:ubiquinone/menaquinone biosynthesis C-methylase UbiE